MQDPENNHSDYGIERKFWSGWRDSRFVSSSGVAENGKAVKQRASTIFISPCSPEETYVFNGNPSNKLQGLGGGGLGFFFLYSESTPDNSNLQGK